MIKKIYAKLGTGMTLEPIRIETAPRTYVLESQQQNTSVVPANEQTQPSVGTVACAAEARPDLDPHGNPLEAITCHSCDRDNFEPFFSDRGVRLVCHDCKASEWLGFGSVPPEFE